MTNIHQLDAHDTPISREQIEGYLSELNLTQGLGMITKLASRQLWFSDAPEVVSKVNLTNLSLLAKAIVLYASADGREWNTSETDSNDLMWLLKAINSMRWHPRSEYQQDDLSARISFVMRNAYVRHSIAEHPASSLARAFAMFHERLPYATNNTEDLDAALSKSIGLGRSDLWMLCSAIYMFYYGECAKDGGPWVISPTNFFGQSPKEPELKAKLQNALSAIAKTPSEIRKVYQTDRKYHDSTAPEEYWSSEFNILKDFPIVNLGDDNYCCPFPVFAWVRGAVGYYFDLGDYYEQIETRDNPKNPNPKDNQLSRDILGAVFQDYVGVQLESLSTVDQYLRPEFKYSVGKKVLDSPDWLLERLPDLPVLFECKARRPTLAMQTQCREHDRESEAKTVIARAIAQLCKFLRNANAGHTTSFTFGTNDKCVYALVLYDPFPFHAIEEIRNIIEREAIAKDSDWQQFKQQVSFVPLSIQELELACLIEQKHGELIEHQFEKYAAYRDQAKTLVGKQFAKHFFEFALDEWGIVDEIMTQTSKLYWEQFTNFMFMEIFDERIADYEEEQRERWIAEAAYFRWINTGRGLGQELQNWNDSVDEYEQLTKEHGMPPYQEVRLRPLKDIPNRFK